MTNLRKQIRDLPHKAVPTGAELIEIQEPGGGVGSSKYTTLSEAIALALGAVSSVNARTGAVILTSADVGLSNANNTSDVDKPVSTAQAAADATVLSTAETFATAAVAAEAAARAAADALLAPINSPTFTGVAAAATAAPGTNTTQLATTAFVEAAVGGGGGGSFLPIDPITKKIDNSAVTGDFANGAVWLDIGGDLSQFGSAYHNHIWADANGNAAFSHDEETAPSTYNTFAAYSYSNFTAGVGNTVGGAYNVTHGLNNVVTAGSRNTVVGHANTLSGTDSLVVGDRNINVKNKSLVVGILNNIGSYSNVLLVGASLTADIGNRAFLQGFTNGIKLPYITGSTPSDGVFGIDPAVKKLTYYDSGAWHIVGASDPIVSTQAVSYAEVATSGVQCRRLDATGGVVDVSLPTAVGNTATFRFKKIDASANVVNINGFGGVETLDGAITATLLSQYESFDLISNGTNWDIY